MAVQRYFPLGSLAQSGWQVRVDETTPGWEHGRLAVGAYSEAPGGSFTLEAGLVEYVVVPLDGATTVTTTGGQTWELGRDQQAGMPYFGFTPDIAYIGSGDGAVLTGSGRVAVASAPVPAAGALPSAFVARGKIETLLRGAGGDTRQVHNLAVPGVVNAQRLIVVEVLTPGGNWSSYPPHKHDEDLPGHEANLAEIYYFDAAPTPALARPEEQRPDTQRPHPVRPDGPATGLFHTYSSPATEISIAHRIYPGDVALVPGGYHGPASAMPQWDMYYLNVMVGPNTDPATARDWLISDDPAYAWIRDEWAHQETDPRLPYHNN